MSFGDSSADKPIIPAITIDGVCVYVWVLYEDNGTPVGDRQ